MSENVENPRWFVKVVRNRRLQSITDNDLKRFRQGGSFNYYKSVPSLDSVTQGSIGPISELVYSVDENGRHRDHRIATEDDISAQRTPDMSLAAKYLAHPKNHLPFLSALVGFVRKHSH